jgi:hypothetical protein
MERFPTDEPVSRGPRRCNSMAKGAVCDAVRPKDVAKIYSRVG